MSADGNSVIKLSQSDSIDSTEIQETAQAAVHEAMIAARDTAREINETTKGLKDLGVIKQTSIAVEETAAAAHEIGETARETGQQVGGS